MKALVIMALERDCGEDARMRVLYQIYILAVKQERHFAILPINIRHR